MAFSEFSLTAGVTANPDAIVEQWMCFNYLFNSDPDGIFDAQAVVGDFSKLLFINDPASAPPAVMILEQGINLYIYIGGTNLVASGNIANVMGATVPANFGAGVYCNRWILTMAQRVDADIQAVLPLGWQTRRLHWYGHSQGGAIALMLATAYVTQYGAMSSDVIAIASPKVFSGAAIPPGSVPRYGFVLTNFGDPVPKVPPSGTWGVINHSPLALFSVGTPLNWHHIVPTLVLKTDNSYVYVDPAHSYFDLSVSDLRNIADTHPFAAYSQRICSWWESNFA